MADPPNRGEARGGRLRSFAAICGALARGDEAGRAAIREAAATSGSFVRACGYSYQHLARALGLLAAFADFATVDRVATSVLLSLRHPRLRLEEWKPNEGGWPRPSEPGDGRAAALEDVAMARSAADAGADDAAAVGGGRDGEIAVPSIDFGKEPRGFAPTAAELPFLQAIAVPAWVFADGYGMGTGETLASSILGRMAALAGSPHGHPLPAGVAGGSNASRRGEASAAAAAVRAPPGIAISTGQSIGVAPPEATRAGRDVAATMSSGSGADSPRLHPVGDSPAADAHQQVRLSEEAAAREIGPGDDDWLGIWLAARGQALLPADVDGSPAGSTPTSSSGGSGSGFGTPAVRVADIRFTVAPVTVDESTTLRQAISFARDTSLQTFAALVRCGLLQLQRPASALPLPLAKAGRRAAVLAALASHDPSSIRDTKVRRDVRGAEYAPAHPGSPALSTGGHAWRSFQSSLTASGTSAAVAASSITSGTGSGPSSSSSSSSSSASSSYSRSSSDTLSSGSSLLSDARGPRTDDAIGTGGSSSTGVARGGSDRRTPPSVPRLPLGLLPCAITTSDDAAGGGAVAPPFNVPEGGADAASAGDASVATIFSPTSGHLRRTRSGRLVAGQHSPGDSASGSARQPIAGAASATRSHRIMASVIAAAEAHATVTGGGADRSAGAAAAAVQSARVRRLTAAMPLAEDSTQAPLSAVVAAACGGIFGIVPPPVQVQQQAAAGLGAVSHQPHVAGSLPLTIGGGGSALDSGVRSPFFVPNERVQHQVHQRDEEEELLPSGERLVRRRNAFCADAAVGDIAIARQHALSPFGAAAGSPAVNGSPSPSSPGGIRRAFVRSHHRRGTSDGSALASWPSQGGAPSSIDVSTTTGAFALLGSVPGVRHVAGAPSLHQLAALNRSTGISAPTDDRDTSTAASRFGGWFFAGALWSSKPAPAVGSSVPASPVPQATALAAATTFKRHYFGLRKPTPHRIGLPSGYDSSFLAGPSFPRNTRTAASDDAGGDGHWLRKWAPLLSTGVYPLTRLEHQYRRCTGAYQHFLLPLTDSPREVERGGADPEAAMVLQPGGSPPPLVAPADKSPQDGGLPDALEAGGTPRPPVHTSKLSALLYGAALPPTPMADVTAAATSIRGVRVDPFSAPHLYFDGGMSAVSLPHASGAVYPGGGGSLRGDQLLLGTHASLPVTQHDMRLVIAAELPSVLAECCGQGLTCAAGAAARISSDHHHDHHHHGQHHRHYHGKVPPLLEALFSDAVCGGDVQATADAMVALLTDTRALHAGLRAAHLTLKLCTTRRTALPEPGGGTVIAAARAGADFTPPLTAISGVPGGRLVIPYLTPQLHALAASGGPLPLIERGGGGTSARRHTPSSGHYHRRDPTPPPSARSAAHDTSRCGAVSSSAPSLLPPYALNHLPTAADASARDGFGRTLLHALAANESWCSDASGGAKWATMLAQAVALCDAGADPLAVDSLGHTPLHAILTAPHANGAGPVAFIAVLAWYAFGAPADSAAAAHVGSAAGKRLVPSGGRRSLLSLAVEHASAEALAALLQPDVALARGVVHYSRWAWQHSAASITAPQGFCYRAWADGVPSAMATSSQADLSPHARGGNATTGHDSDDDAPMAHASAAAFAPAPAEPLVTPPDLHWPHADATSYLTAAFGPSVNDRTSASGAALLQVFITHRVESLRPATAAAVWPGHRAILRGLLLAGAAMEARWDVPDRGQRTALQVLLSLARHSPAPVRAAVLDCMAVLLEVGGADPLAPNTIDGKTPLHEAACTRDGAAAKLLLSYAGPAALLSASEARGRRPLQLVPVDSVRMDGYTGHVPVARFVAMCRKGAAAGTRRRRRHALAAFWHANRDRLQEEAQAATVAAAAAAAMSSPPPPARRLSDVPPSHLLPLPASTAAPALGSAAGGNGSTGTGAGAMGAGVLSAPNNNSDGGRASKWMRRTFGGLLPGSK